MKPKSVIDSKMIRDNPDGMEPVSLSTEIPRWEYKSVAMHREADLNFYGKDGWDLVTVIAQPGDRIVAYFRRVRV